MRRSSVFSSKMRRVNHERAAVVVHVVLYRPVGARGNNDAVHALQHVSFFGSALLFWWTIIHAHAPGGRARAVTFGTAVLLLFGTALHSGALGGLLTFSRTLWYPAYGNAAAAWGLSPLEDQQLAGLIMWIPATFAYLVAALFLFAGWLRASEERVHQFEIVREAERVRSREGEGEGDAWA